MTDTFAFLVFTFIAVLGFEAVNGWTDAPNAVATVVSTRVLTPVVALAMAATLNLVGALSGTAVATTIGKDIIDLDLHPGIETSLLAKLNTAIDKLQDDNAKNDKAAVNSLQAFINAVEAQYGKKIPEQGADSLITAAQQILDLLTG